MTYIGKFDNTQYPTTWQNFRYDVADWIHDHAAMLLAVILVAFLLTLSAGAA